MLHRKRIKAKDLHEVKGIINRMSRDYDNLIDFCVLETDNMVYKYVVNLFFSPNEKNNVKEKIWVEYILDVSYDEIDSIIQHLNLDFSGYIKADIFRNRDNKYIANMIVTYKVSGFFDDTKLTYIKYFSGGGGNISLGYEYYRQYCFFKYKGKAYNSYIDLENEIGFDLYYMYSKDHILITKSFTDAKEDALFKLKFVDDSICKVRITKLTNNLGGVYQVLPVEVETKEVNIKDTYSIVNYLVFMLEEELHIKISESTIEYFNNVLKNHIEHRI